MSIIDIGDDIESEIWFDELLKFKTPHHFRLINWRTPVEHNVAGTEFYIVNAIALERYSHLLLSKGQPFKLHLGVKSFGRAMKNFMTFHNVRNVFKRINGNDLYVLEMSLERQGRKSINLDHFKLIKILGADEEETVLEIVNGNVLKHPDFPELEEKNEMG